MITRQFFILIIISIWSVSSVSAQLLETRQNISVSYGYGNLNGGEGNLFFPSSSSQTGSAFDIGYTHKIKPWVSGGLSLGYSSFSSNVGSPGFTEVSASGETLLSVGPNILFHSPFKTSGVFNWLQLGVSVVPNYNQYSGERILFVDNEVISLGNGSYVEPILSMNEKSSGFGVKLSPEINYRITQRVGIKVAYNLQLLSVYTGYERESISTSSFMGGLIITFGNSKVLF